MTDLAERITREFELEQLSNAKAVNPDDIPISYESITPEWLTHFLCKGYPEARVVSHRLDAPDDGNTNRRRIFLTYNAAGNAARLPASVFCKASNQLHTRLMNARGGLIQGENAFYNTYRRLLDIEAPRCFLATYNPQTFNSIFVLDDLVRYGVVFCDHTAEISLQNAQSQMALLAQLHGRFYDSTAVNASDLPTFETIFDNIDSWLGWENYCSNGFLAAEAVIPVGLFRQYAKIWPITLQSVAMHGSLPRTFTHNDVHLRNWYISPTGQMVLCDWQCFGRGHWARDVAYALTTSLTVDNRRRWENELLRFYLDKFQAAGGPVISFDDAWKLYRKHLFSALTFWTSTLAFAITHPSAASLEFIQRIPCLGTAG